MKKEIKELAERAGEAKKKAENAAEEQHWPVGGSTSLRAVNDAGFEWQRFHFADA